MKQTPQSANPFGLSTPSVFAVSSPLQVLCAAAVIRQLEIKDYKIVVCYQKGDPRNEQLWAILDCFEMYNRTLMQLNRINVIFYRFRSKLHLRNRYKRLFIGDFRGYYDFILGSSFVSDGADIVYLDDGNVTLSLLNNVFTEPMPQIWKTFLNHVASRRNFVLNKNLLTLYGDVHNPKYNILPLHLEYVTYNYKKSDAQLKGVYIVGTNIDRYCDPLGISKEMFINKLDDLMSCLRKEYRNETITYIPHGCDRSEYARELCQRFGYEFRRPKMMVEMELLDNKCQPLAIYGFTSSALFNLKKMFPHTRVVNVLYHSEDNQFFEEYRMISNYYSQNGIQLVEQEL